MRPLITASLAVTGMLAVAALQGGGGAANAAPGTAVQVQAPGYRVSWLEPSSPLRRASGLAVDNQGHLFAADPTINTVYRVDLRTRAIERIATDFDAYDGDASKQPALSTPEDLEIDADGNLYVAETFGGRIVRMRPDGTGRKVVASRVTSGRSGPTGIGWLGKRLFVTAASDAPGEEGALWEVDPSGETPAVAVMTGLGAAQSVTFGPDGLGYITDFHGGVVNVVDVDRHLVVRTLDGFDQPFANEFHPDGYLVVTEQGSGRVWRVDPDSGAKQLLAQGRQGMDPVTIAADGTIYVANQLRGPVCRLDTARGELEPLFREGQFAYPMSVNPGSDGSLWVADVHSIARLDSSGDVGFRSSFVNDENQFLTTGVLEVGDNAYFSEFLPLGDQRITRINLRTRERQVVARGFVVPVHIRPGPDGSLLVLDAALGLVRVDPVTGVVVPLLADPSSVSAPVGLAYDPAKKTAYVSDWESGRIVSVDLTTLQSAIIAEGFDVPEGVALDGRGGLLVVEGDAERLVRLDLATRVRSVVATGLPTKLRGATVDPLKINIPADVMVRPVGDVVITGNADGSVIVLRAR